MPVNAFERRDNVPTRHAVAVCMADAAVTHNREYTKRCEKLSQIQYRKAFSREILLFNWIK